MPKRIGMILDATFPPDPRVENEASILIQNGFEVYLFCLTYGDEKLEETKKGIRIRRYSSNRFLYKLSALAYDLGLYHFFMKRKISHFIKKNHIDVLHVHDIRIGKAVFQANQKFNLKVVLDLHDDYPEIMKFYPHIQKFPGKYFIHPDRWKKAEEKLINLSEKVITVSPEFVRNLKRRFPKMKDKFVLVPNSISASFYSNYKIDESIISKYKNDFVLLYLGDTHLRRGLLTAIESLPSLRKEILNIKLVIVGKSSTDSILKQKVADLLLKDCVDFEGWQDVSLFPSYILSADIGICPLERNAQHDVAYANKLFQYMSLGLPLLVSNAKAQEKLVQDYNVGLVHKEKDFKDFERKVARFYEDKKMTKEMGERAKDITQSIFAWEQTSKDFITLYQEITS